MGSRYFLCDHRATHLPHLVDVLDGIHALGMCRLDLLEAERIQVFSGKFSVVAGGVLLPVPKGGN